MPEKVFQTVMSALHNDDEINPQFAEIVGDNHVLYAFRMNAVKDFHGNKNYLMDPADKKLAMNSYVPMLQLRLALYPMDVTITNEDDIRIDYTPQSPEETEEIRNFLENIPNEGTLSITNNEIKIL